MFAVVFALASCASARSTADADAIERAGPFHSLEYRSIGPAAGGRISRVAGVPGDPRTCWAATAAGGVWKSTNGGTTWSSVFDDQPVSSIGSIAVSPVDANVVWVGSGEANVRGNVGEGNGIYKSTDGGEQWEHVWVAEGQIGTMIAHPHDVDIAFAAALGSPFGATAERGVYRTTDGGQTWERVLFIDEDTGASDVCFDPSNPRILFAGMWQMRRSPWNLTSGGPGSGLWTSRDGGDTWTRLEGGDLPDGIWGRIGVAVAPTDGQRVYALIEAEDGGLFRSDDGGESWTHINATRGVRQRAWYYSHLTVDPTNSDIVWFPQVGLLRTVDGGRSIRRVTGGGWDYHDIWIDPMNTDRILIASDAGVSLSRDGGASWRRPPLPISQFYHISVDSHTPYRVLGSLQDRGTVRGPSDTLHGGGILLSDWHSVGGGEAGHVVADPSNPDVVWAGEYLGIITRWDGRTSRAPHVGIYPATGSGRGAADLRYRFQWTAPIVISPHDSETVYHAANVLFRTTDRGQTWTPISPDLSRDDETRQQWSGGPITGDNTGVEYYGTIFAVAESPVEPGVIWAGTDDGLVHITRDHGASWTDVTPGDMPEWATVKTIEASRWDEGRAYMVADRHRLDDESPYIWKTENHGASWTRLGRDLDDEVYLHVVREDTRNERLLYLGTERGVMVSHDDGETWTTLRLNMPTVAVVDLAVAGDDLVVGTLGRSAWVLDDLTPVRAMSDGISDSPAHLFPPRETTRWHYGSGWAQLGSDEGAGRNPPHGAAFTYYLSATPDDPIRLEIRTTDGEVLRTLRSEVEPQYTTEDHPDWDPETELKPALSTTKGFNRVAWDLACDAPPWPPIGRYDFGAPSPMPTVPPGEYVAALIVGETTSTQPLRIVADPRTETSTAALQAQFEFLLDLRRDMTTIAEMITTIESVRSQLAGHAERLKDDPAYEDIIAMGQRIDDSLADIARTVHNVEAEVNYDVLGGRHGGAKLGTQLQWLAGSSADHNGPPTQGMIEVYTAIRAQRRVLESRLEAVIDGDLAELNARARAQEVPWVQP